MSWSAGLLLFLPCFLVLVCGAPTAVAAQGRWPEWGEGPEGAANIFGRRRSCKGRCQGESEQEQEQGEGGAGEGKGQR